MIWNEILMAAFPRKCCGSLAVSQTEDGKSSIRPRAVPVGVVSGAHAGLALFFLMLSTSLNSGGLAGSVF